MKLIMPPRSPYLPHRNLHRLPNRQLRAFRTRHHKTERYVPRKRGLATEPETDLFFVAAEIDHGCAVAALPGMNPCLPEYSHRKVRDLLHIDRGVTCGPEETFFIGINDIATGRLQKVVERKPPVHPRQFRTDPRLAALAQHIFAIQTQQITLNLTVRRHHNSVTFTVRALFA